MTERTWKHALVPCSFPQVPSNPFPKKAWVPKILLPQVQRCHLPSRSLSNTPANLRSLQGLVGPLPAPERWPRHPQDLPCSGNEPLATEMQMCAFTVSRQLFADKVLRCEALGQPPGSVLVGLLVSFPPTHCGRAHASPTSTEQGCLPISLSTLRYI